ncbi:hypothetical protein NDU88_006535 [Pleurodeles waltl]|uniref:Uncharacterized protein n=1 Tax=Pleurodeles waltl TaxID=8319 RepID=A0AAV7MZI4_PLEWA|nr:hypothetical protein NDU88_006535 [Pleurodeles waltl]
MTDKRCRGTLGTCVLSASPLLSRARIHSLLLRYVSLLPALSDLPALLGFAPATDPSGLSFCAAVHRCCGPGGRVPWSTGVWNYTQDSWHSPHPRLGWGAVEDTSSQKDPPGPPAKQAIWSLVSGRLQLGSETLKPLPVELSTMAYAGGQAYK